MFSINTKHLSGRVDVRREEVRRNRRATRYIEAATQEAQRVRAVLEAHIGEAVTVEPLLVIYGADVRVDSQPRDVTVLAAAQLVRWLMSLPPVLSFAHWQRRCRAATTPATWTAPEPKRGQRIDTPEGPVSVRCWQRYGKDRLYVHSLAGEEHGYADLTTGDVHARSVAGAEAVRHALTAWLRT